MNNHMSDPIFNPLAYHLGKKPTSSTRLEFEADPEEIIYDNQPSSESELNFISERLYEKHIDELSSSQLDAIKNHLTICRVVDGEALCATVRDDNGSHALISHQYSNLHESNNSSNRHREKYDIVKHLAERKLGNRKK